MNETLTLCPHHVPVKFDACVKCDRDKIYKKLSEIFEKVTVLEDKVNAG